MSTPSVTLASRESYVLAEGPVWDRLRHVLMWVDIQRGLVLTGRLHEDGTVTEEERVRFPGTVGAVAPSADSPEEWIVAGADRVLYRDADGRVTDGPVLLSPDSTRRLNDGKPDPAGRFLVGSLSLEGESHTETLVVVRETGSVDTVDDDLTLSNGLAWSPAGDTLYSVDTIRRTISRRGWDPAGSVPTSPRETFVTLTDGYPDGICMDTEGALWVAVWGLGEVRRYTSDGHLDTVVAVPAPHVSSVAFGGTDLRTLIVTTATDGLSDQQRAEHPFSGHLFTLRTTVPGVVQPFWRGRPRRSADAER